MFFLLTYFHFGVVTGILEGYDPLNNLVLDGAVEIFPNGTTRPLGLMLVRGSAIAVLQDADGAMLSSFTTSHKPE